MLISRVNSCLYAKLILWNGTQTSNTSKPVCHDYSAGIHKATSIITKDVAYFLSHYLNKFEKFFMLIYLIEYYQIADHEFHSIYLMLSVVPV